MKKRLYYNEIEIPWIVRYISESRNINVQYEADQTPDEFPQYLNDMFKALKKGEFDDIIVNLSRHIGCYTSKCVESSKDPETGYVFRIYTREPIVGEVSLKDYSNGGGSARDKRMYKEDIEYWISKSRSDV